LLHVFQIDTVYGTWLCCLFELQYCIAKLVILSQTLSTLRLDP
jgi:hypothetical protein